jgi:hypothetical protein
MDEDTIKEGEKFWLLAYVGPSGFVQQRVNWTEPKDIIDIWRDRPEAAHYAIVRKFLEGRPREVLNSRDGFVAVDILDIKSWFSDKVINKKQFTQRRFKNLDQAIMVCAMRSG